MMEGQILGSLYDIEVFKIIQETKSSVSKIEADIEKISSRGLPELNLHPPGYDNPNTNQIKKNIEILKNNIEGLKTYAFKEVEKAVDKYPEAEKNSIKEAAKRELFPEQEVKTDKRNEKQIEMSNEKNTEELSFSQRYGRSLGFSRFMNDKSYSLGKEYSHQEIFKSSAGEKEK